MKILVFIHLLLLIGVTNCKLFRNAAVTVIIDTNNNIEAINCPKRIYAKRSDFRQKGSIVSFIKANFLCNIVFITEPVGELPSYHVSISPQFNASLVGCVKFHNCYNLEIDQIKGRNIKFDIKASSPCLEEVLRFRFELKKKNNIIHVSETDVIIGSTPPIPTNLEYIWKNNTVFLVGILESVCKNIFKLSDYYAEYKVQRAKSITSDKVHCDIIKQSYNHLIYCKLIDFRDYPNIQNTSVCNSKAATYVYGINSGISSKITKTSSLLAINKMHGISLLVDRMELNTLYVKFNSSIVCNPSLTKINLVIYQKVNEHHNKISKHVTCTSFHNCRFSLDSLSSGTRYNICVYQQDIFDNIYVHSGTSCIIGTTITLPCVKSSLVNTTKILEGSFYWKASLSFRKDCNDRNVYTLVEVLQNNKTIVFNKTFNFLNYISAKGIIKNLHLQKHYRLILKSCNFYGCQQNENIYLEPPLHHSKFNIKQDKDGKQKTYTILVICFSFLLVLIALCYLTYFLLKRRGKLTPPQPQQQTSSANTELLQMQDSQHDMAAVLELIPENSTLV